MGDIELFADHAQKSSAWTPRQCLESALAAMEAGEIRPDALVIAWYEKGEDGESTYGTRCAASMLKDAASMLQVSLADVIDEMRG